MRFPLDASSVEALGLDRISNFVHTAIV